MSASWCFVGLLFTISVLLSLPLSESCSVDGGDFFQVVEVAEETPVGTLVGRLHLDDPGRVKELSLEIPNSYIDLVLDDSGKGASFAVSQRIDLDKSGLSSLQTMTIDCVQVNGVKLKIDIEFELTDTNDHAPIFQPSNQYNFSVAETLSVGAQVGVVSARDGDLNNYYVNYEWLDMELQLNQRFELKSLGNGAVAIILASPLDYETESLYTLHIVAKDCQERKECETNQRSSTATVTIRVQNEDDLNPKFDQPAYKVLLSENVTNGEFVVQVTAYDQDDINEKILYTVSGDGIEYFEIDKLSGKLTVRDSMGLHVGDVFMFFVKAEQASDPSRFDMATLQISIITATWERPKFTESSYVTSVSEYEAVNSILLTMAINYNMKEDPLAVELLNTNSQIPFSTRHLGNNVELVLARELDYEKESAYTIKIAASNSVYTDEAEVTVNVLNENDNNPVFEQTSYSFSVLYSEQGIVGRVRAKDVDEIDKSPKYSLLPSEFSSLFVINETGWISLTSPQAFYTSTSYTIVIEASDHGRPSRSANVVARVTLTDVTAGAMTDDEKDSSTKMFGYIIIGSATLLVAAITGVLVYYISRKVQQSNLRKQDKELSYGVPPQDDPAFAPLSPARHRDNSSLGLMSVINGRHENTYRDMSDLNHDEKYRTILKSSHGTLADQSETRALLTQRLYETGEAGTSSSSDSGHSSGMDSASTHTHHRSQSDSAASSYVPSTSQQQSFIASYQKEHEGRIGVDTNYGQHESGCLEAPEQFRCRHPSTASNTSDYGSNIGAADINIPSHLTKSKIPEDSLLPEGSSAYSGQEPLKHPAEMIVINSSTSCCQITADLVNSQTHKKPFSTFHGNIV